MRAPQAQVIYSLAPVWSAVIAQMTLGGESMGITSWAGGSAILFASFLASRPMQSTACSTQWIIGTGIADCMLRVLGDSTGATWGLGS